MRYLRCSRVARIVLAFLLLMPSVSDVAAQASPTPAAVSYDQAKQTLQRLVIEAQRIQGQLDASQYDLDALSAKLGLKASDIVTYVHDNIAFEQYPGLLRGAKWTLIGRAGNSIDQAVLLATLLAKAGYEIKIEHGKLNPEQATNLLLQMQAPRKAPDKIGNLDAIKTLVKQMARSAGLSDAQVQQYLDALGQQTALPPADATSLDADVAAITATLDGAGVKLGDPANLANLATEASDYFWVSYRKTLDDKWADAHPAFKTGDAPTVTATESFDAVASIPDADKQTIKIEPIIERSVNGTISQKSLATPIEGPADQLAGTSMFFTTLSNAAAVVTDPNTNINDILTKADLFMVQFNNHTADNTTVVFDDHGSLFNLKQLKPGEFGLQPQTGEVIASAVAGVIGALGGEPTPTPGPAPDLKLTGLWLNVTFTAPGGQTTTERRMIVDRIGPANRAAGKATILDPNDRAAVAAALAQNVSMYASVADTSTAYLTSQYIDRIVQVEPLLLMRLRANYFPNESIDVTGQQRDAVGTAWTGFAGILATFDLIAKNSQTVVSYRSAPAFVTYREEIVPDASAKNGWATSLGLDVVSNPRRAYATSDGTMTNSPADAIRAGVWETRSETVPDVAEAKATTANTPTVMAAARSQGIALKVVKSAADLTGIQMSAAGLGHLADDLAAGYVAIVPEKTPSGQPMSGWWRIDPKTGVTLGMLENGRGAEMAEYQMLLSSVACVGFSVWAGMGPISTAIGCGFLIGGAAAAIGGASAGAGIIIAVIGFILAGIANKGGV